MSRQDDRPQFDAASVRADWDYASDAYTQFQADGHDTYRYLFFGPAHVALCGVVRGLRVLDLGCGNGYLSRELAGLGAIVTGIDISANQIGHAQRMEADAPLGIAYEVLDAAEIGDRFAPESFNMVTACLSLQDMPDTARVIASAATLLRPGGRLVFSITHPVTDLPVHKWQTDDNGVRIGLTIGGYYATEPLSFTWRGERFRYEFTTRARRATLSEWLGWVIDAGLDIRRLDEPRPTDDVVARAPELFDATLIPTFLLVDAAKPGHLSTG